MVVEARQVPATLNDDCSNCVRHGQQAELRDRQAAIQQGLEYIAKLEGMVRDAQTVNTRMNKEVNVLQDKV